MFEFLLVACRVASPGMPFREFANSDENSYVEKGPISPCQATSFVGAENWRAWQLRFGEYETFDTDMGGRKLRLSSRW